jgi:hypothetical protein
MHTGLLLEATNLLRCITAFSIVDLPTLARPVGGVGLACLSDGVLGREWILHGEPVTTTFSNNVASSKSDNEQSPLPREAAWRAEWTIWNQLRQRIRRCLEEIYLGCVARITFQVPWSLRLRPKP